MGKVKGQKKKKSHQLKSNNPLVQIRADALKAIEEQRAPASKALEAEDHVPRCVVVKKGKVGRYAQELVSDLRTVMSPYTPVNLKEKKTNTIKDYVAVAGVLGLSHLMTITQTNKGPNLGISRVPRGPTLHFKILGFSPSSFIRKVLKEKAGGNSKRAFLNPPLVVLNNFDDEENPRHVKIVAVTFQAMFPAINVKTVKLNECRRVLLVNYERETDTFEIRHYFIRADPQGASRTVRKLLKSRIPNMGQKQDVSEIVDPGIRFGDGGETSDSEVEDAAASVALPQAFPGRGNQAGKRSVVKLREIGPRLSLQLVKVQEGIFDGEVQYHKFESRTQQEVLAQREAVKEKERLVEERRQKQAENVEKKKAAEAEKQEKKRQRLAARKEKMLAKAKTFEGAELLKDASTEREDDDDDDDDIEDDDDDGDDEDEDNEQEEEEEEEEEENVDEVMEEAEEQPDDDVNENSDDEDL